MHGRKKGIKESIGTYTTRKETKDVDDPTTSIQGISKAMTGWSTRTQRLITLLTGFEHT